MYSWETSFSLNFGHGNNRHHSRDWWTTYSVRHGTFLTPTEMGKLRMDSSPLVTEVIRFQVWENHPEKSLIDLGILPWKNSILPFPIWKKFHWKISSGSTHWVKQERYSKGMWAISLESSFSPFKPVFKNSH